MGKRRLRSGSSDRHDAGSTPSFHGNVECLIEFCPCRFSERELNGFIDAPYRAPLERSTSPNLFLKCLSMFRHDQPPTCTKCRAHYGSVRSRILKLIGLQVDDGNTGATSSPFDNFHGCVNIIRVEIRHLQLGNLTDLVSSDLSNTIAP